MDGIEKITARIRADADAELAQLREQTETQILEIRPLTRSGPPSWPEAGGRRRSG